MMVLVAVITTPGFTWPLSLPTWGLIWMGTDPINKCCSVRPIVKTIEAHAYPRGVKPPRVDISLLSSQEWWGCIQYEMHGSPVVCHR
jgi:hypothetical protein